MLSSQADPKLLKDLKKAELRFSSDEQAGINRKKSGESFVYLDASGHKVKKETTLERIKSLVIPPAWQDVWVCSSPTGYLQATGVDEKGRKQYLYHPEWTKLSQQNKFSKVVDFGMVLPEIRRKIYRDMLDETLSKDKILATVVWLLEHTLIRVGNDEYAKENNSFGLTTLRMKHVSVDGKTINFNFRGKSGVDHSISISNPKIAQIIKECIELPGYEIFQYMDDGEKHVVDSADVNAYLKSLTGEDITAKDFRTWGGTTLSAQTLHKIGPAEGEKDAKDKIAEAIKTASSHLGNTQSVCRSYYVHPTVLETYQKNILVPHFNRVHEERRSMDKLSQDEFAVLTLLERYS